jgi:enterochelin esterase-like enzyme
MQNITPCCAPMFDGLYPGMALTPDEAAAFHDFIQQEVAPFLASRLPLDATHLALMGASLGGLFALNAMLRRPTRRGPSHKQPQETE